jgi:hypothetical protein
VENVTILFEIIEQEQIIDRFIFGKNSVAVKIFEEIGFGKSFLTEDNTAVLAYIKETLKDPLVLIIQKYTRKYQVKTLVDVVNKYIGVINK